MACVVPRRYSFIDARPKVIGLVVDGPAVRPEPEPSGAKNAKAVCRDA
jgi:hypothetical protein